MRLFLVFLACIIFTASGADAQERSLVNTSHSPYARLTSLDLGDVSLTSGFWGERYRICRDSMVPLMMDNYMSPEISHSWRNFEIAAGLVAGDHKGPSFHDGDFYKILEGMIMVWSLSQDTETEKLIDHIIETIAKTQRADGYINTAVVIKQRQAGSGEKEFNERLGFETYNMGHLMTAACLHYRLTGKKNFLNTAVRAADFLYDYCKRHPAELAQNAICPSHYMGIVELYRTTGERRYLELASKLVVIRNLVENGTDDNQDRIPFTDQDKAVGHAVRANYLYAGVADLYMETGNDTLMKVLDRIWHDLTEHRMYITGGCGALYDGVSPDGTSYSPAYIQKVHQAYGREYQLPNLTAHNESCANIGNMLWNWRMFLATGEARFTDVMELVMYNSLLSAVSLDGKGYFYTNPLCVNRDIPFTLRWSKDRESYIKLCNCCPPNTIRTIAEISGYMYAASDRGLWINIYGSNTLRTSLKDGSPLCLTQETDYPWNGNISVRIGKCPKAAFSIFFRIPGWCRGAVIGINGQTKDIEMHPGTYVELRQNWKEGDIIELTLPLTSDLIEANPLVEEVHNHVAVRRGPVVYCLESADIPSDHRVTDYILPAGIDLKSVEIFVGGSRICALEGTAGVVNDSLWTGQLYRRVSRDKQTAPVRLVPYFTWGNRTRGDMSVWLPVSK